MILWAWNSFFPLPLSTPIKTSHNSTISECRGNYYFLIIPFGTFPADPKMEYRWVFLFFSLLSITAIPSWFFFPRQNVAAPGSFDSGSIVTLSWKPRIFLYKGFLSHEECDHIMKLAKRKLGRSMVVDNESGKDVMSNVRTSTGMFLNKRQDEVIARIEERIATWTLLPEDNAENIQVLHYDLTEKYDAHFDYFSDKQNQARGGNRYATLLMYLSDVELGGETVFPDAEGWESQPKDDTFSDCAKRGLAVKPVKGDAVLFFSQHPDGVLDPKSLHASCPVIKGEKWSAPKWIRARSFDSVETSPHETHVETSTTESYPESSSTGKLCTSESCEELITSVEESQIDRAILAQTDEVQEK